jgi:hypothetical protein
MMMKGKELGLKIRHRQRLLVICCGPDALIIAASEAL